MTEIAYAAPAAQSLLAWIAAAKQGLPSPATATATSLLDDIRLEDLVLRLLDLDIEEAVQLDVFADSDTPFSRSPERFYESLQQAIRQLRLFKLFARTHDGDYHRSICPAAYNERTGEHYPEVPRRPRFDLAAPRSLHMEGIRSPALHARHRLSWRVAAACCQIPRLVSNKKNSTARSGVSRSE